MDHVGEEVSRRNTTDSNVLTFVFTQGNSIRQDLVGGSPWQSKQCAGPPRKKTGIVGKGDAPDALLGDVGIEGMASRNLTGGSQKTTR